ncbi:hypothetical protein P7C70_g4226, partial [Phenoliferia sp. Uapishka_3]
MSKRPFSPPLSDEDARPQSRQRIDLVPTLPVPNPFPSDQLLPDEPPPQLVTLDSQDIKLPEEPPRDPPPFPSADELQDLPPPILAVEQDGEDDTFLPPSPPHTYSPTVPAAPTDPEAAAPSIYLQEMSSPAAHRPVLPAPEPPRRSSTGQKVAEIETIAEFWDGDEILEAVDEPKYAYDESLNSRVSVWRGDITSLNVDAIVNAANSRLLGGGGVDGAIHSAAGRELLSECRLLNGAETGESKITHGYKLPAKYIIHTVGPVYSYSEREECEALLRSCYQTTLETAIENGVKTLAFSGISTGIYGYPLDAATRVALDVTRNFLASPDGASLDRVIFTVFRNVDVQSYMTIVPEFFPPAPAALTSNVLSPEVKIDVGNELASSTTFPESEEEALRVAFDAAITTTPVKTKTVYVEVDSQIAIPETAFVEEEAQKMPSYRSGNGADEVCWLAVVRESWQPSWGIRTALIALMAFFSSDPKGAVGSLDAPPAERRRLAKCSLKFQCAACGFDAADPDAFPSSPPTPDPSSEPDAVAIEEPSEGAGATTIFPTPRAGMPPATPHDLNMVVPHANPNDATALPIPQPQLQLPPAAAVGVQHRPPDRGGAQAAIEGTSRQGGGGGGPLLIDRAILVVLLALLACVVRKIA